MTFFNFLKLIRHYLKLVILVPLICAIVAGGAVYLTPKTYSATASMLTTADLALATGLAQSESVKYSDNGITVNASADATTRSVIITSDGSDYDECIAAANATILATNDVVMSITADAEVPTINDVREADTAVDTSQSITKMVLAALLTGLLLAICIVLIIDILRTPIKGITDIEETSNLPVIGIVPSCDGGERILANVRFIANRIPATIAVVPLSNVGCSEVCSELTGALERAGLRVNKMNGVADAESLGATISPDVVTIVECAPLAAGMGAAYIAKEADFSILCANEWQDSRKTLAATVKELQLAQAKLGGAVFLSSERS